MGILSGSPCRYPGVGVLEHLNSLALKLISPEIHTNSVRVESVGMSVVDCICHLCDVVIKP